MPNSTRRSIEREPPGGEVEQLRVQLRNLQRQHAEDAEKHQTYVEELQTTNEELRLASENLDTHREELQSLNAELLTANRSLQDKIGELGRANGDLRNLMAATAIATVFLDRELCITRYTPAAAKLFHLIEQDVGRPLDDLRQGLHYPEMAADALTVLAHLEPVEREVGGIRGGWFLVRLLPYRTVEDRIDGLVLTCVDITERKQAETLRLAKEAAERVVQARNEFLSRMSHELRTPLNAILGFGQVLALEARDEQDKMALDLILKAGHHLLSLVNEVLDLSQVEGGELRLKMDAVDLRQLARECMGLVAKLAEANRVACRIQEPDLRLGLLWTDEQRLRQVLLNLLTNAVKYNRPGGCVTFSFQPDAAGHCLIRIQDTGLGIATEHLPRLFVPFERLHPEHAEIEGTGLGLAITRRLVETLGGSIGVETELGRGSTFWVKLPVGQAPVNIARNVGVSQRITPTVPTSRSVTLLCIEDNASNVQLVQILVERHWPHWKFLSAPDACTGLEAAYRQVPDLILLDYQLPDRLGDWVLAELRGNLRTARIPVLMLTADATADTRDRLLAGGAADLLRKPFQIGEFTQAINDALRLAPHRNAV